MHSVTVEDNMSTAPHSLLASEVAQLLRCSAGFVYKLARAGKLTYVALGERGPGRRAAMRFPAEAVAAFIEARTITAGREGGTGEPRTKKRGPDVG